jgi:mitochondrial import inner membrane translocase subunit TIM23
MYYVVSASLNMIFEDEFEEMSPLQKNMICGAASGALFKSTLGIVPTCVGGLLGATLIGGLTLGVEEGNRRGWLSFEMK